MPTRRASIELTASTKGLSAGLKQATRQWAAFGKGLGKGVGGKLSLKGMGKGVPGQLMGGLRGVGLGVGGGIGGMLGGLKTAVGLGSVGGLAVMAGNEAAKTLRFESALVRLRIASMGAIKDLAPLRKQIVGISEATGVAREDVLAGARAYVRLTGDTKTALQSMELFAKIAKGQDTAMEDVAGAAARLKQNLHIEPEQFEKAMSIVVRGGKVGSVELNEMAGLLAGLAPRMERFKGGTGLAGLAELGAAFQLTAQGFKDSNEAATGLESLMGAIILRAGRLEAAGVKVYDKDPKTAVKTLRGFKQIIEDISRSKLMKSPTALIKALGRKEAEQTFRMLSRLPGVWDETMASTLAANDVQEDFFEYANSTAGRLETAFVHLQNAIAKTFTPDRIDKFAHALEAALDMAGDFSDWVEEQDKKTKKEGHSTEGESWLWSVFPGAWAVKEWFEGTPDDNKAAEREQAQQMLDAGMTPEQMEKLPGKAPIVSAMRDILAEREEADAARREAEGRAFGGHEIDPEAPLPSEEWSQPPTDAERWPAKPLFPGNDPWRQPAPARRGNGMQVDVKVSASPEFEVKVQRKERVHP